MRNVNFATETKQAFEEKLEAIGDKIEDRINDFTCRLAVVIDAVQSRTPKFCKVFAINLRKVVHGCVSLAHDALNFAVKMSIILIAMIMLYNFAQANPELAIQINETALSIFDHVREAAIQTCEQCKEMILAPFRLFGLFQ